MGQALLEFVGALELALRSIREARSDEPTDDPGGRAIDEEEEMDLEEEEEGEG